MPQRKTPDVGPSLVRLCETQRAHLITVSSMMIESTQYALSNDVESRRLFGLEMADAYMLRGVQPEQKYYIEQRCLYPFRPARGLGDIILTGPSREELSLGGQISASVLTDLKIMWSAYLFSVQRLLNEKPESRILIGLTQNDAKILAATSSNDLRRTVLRGPYMLAPSECLRGLLGPLGTLRPEEILRRCAMDISVDRRCSMGRPEQTR